MEITSVGEVPTDRGYRRLHRVQQGVDLSTSIQEDLRVGIRCELMLMEMLVSEITILPQDWILVILLVEYGHFTLLPLMGVLV